MPSPVFDNAAARRFWSHVDRSGGEQSCWPWTASMLRAGYGQFTYGGHKSIHISAHRVAYILARGPIPDGLLILHSCDNPACCNPAHLSAGTYAANSADALNKLRFPQTRKLGHAEIQEIRRLYATGTMTQASIAKQFGVHQTQVSRIVRRRQWHQH